MIRALSERMGPIGNVDLAFPQGKNCSRTLERSGGLDGRGRSLSRIEPPSFRNPNPFIGWQGTDLQGSSRRGRKGSIETEGWLSLLQKRCAGVFGLLLVFFSGTWLRGQDGSEDGIGFGEIRLGAAVSALPIPCLETVVCEGAHKSLWVRVHPASGRVQRVDVVYSGKRADNGAEVRSSPITLPQAIRGHSIRYGGLAPRLGLAGSVAGNRIIVDMANGIAYVADGALVESAVREVWYLPMTDSVVTAASPLSHQGDWLVNAARSAPRYKNLLPEASGKAPGPGVDRLPREEVTARLARMSSEVRTYSLATLMLSAHVSESLKNHQQPDPAVAAKLWKAFALLSATRDEAAALMKDDGNRAGAEEMQSLPLQLAGQAESRMEELVSEGLVK